MSTAVVARVVYKISHIIYQFNLNVHEISATGSTSISGGKRKGKDLSQRPVRKT
jgi:hypothetical protein